MSGSTEAATEDATEAAIVHEFDEMGRIVGAGERRIATLLGKVMAALGALPPHANEAEIHAVVEDVADDHHAAEASTVHPDDPLPAAQQEAASEANEAKVRQIEEDERARLRGDPQDVKDAGNTKIGGGAIHY